MDQVAIDIAQYYTQNRAIVDNNLAEADRICKEVVKQIYDQDLILENTPVGQRQTERVSVGLESLYHALEQTLAVTISEDLLYIYEELMQAVAVLRHLCVVGQDYSRKRMRE